MAFCPKGFNLGGWMSQSPLTVEHVETFLGPRDFQTIASWGFNSVRLPVDAPFLFSEEGRGALRPERWRMLRRALGWAWDAGLHVALDLHQCPWHSFTDPSLKALWEDDQALSMLCARWEELVSALKGCEGPLWLDLLNEPTAADPRIGTVWRDAWWGRFTGSTREDRGGRIHPVGSCPTIWSRWRTPWRIPPWC
jgi:aryl-phospho-beta-D-glucosidase BglC (GH1 family)